MQQNIPTILVKYNVVRLQATCGIYVSTTEYSESSRLQFKKLENKYPYSTLEPDPLSLTS